MDYRVFIDESGDHSYRDLGDEARRFLGLTGVAIRISDYDPAIIHEFEALKAKYFPNYHREPFPLVRRAMVDKKSHFWVLREPGLRKLWDEDLLEFLSQCPMQVFTVVIDKRSHFENYGTSSWNPYNYGLTVLLERIRGWLAHKVSGTADIMPESRGSKEDKALLESYHQVRSVGTQYTSPESFKEVYPVEDLLFRKKSSNETGLQIADLLAHEQKLLTVQESVGRTSASIGEFGAKVNLVISGKVNRYGRYLLA